MITTVFQTLFLYAAKNITDSLENAAKGEARRTPVDDYCNLLYPAVDVNSRFFTYLKGKAPRYPVCGGKDSL